MNEIHLRDICKQYGETWALQPLSMYIAAHSITCIVGRSGCGKTTLLRILAGLEEPTEGVVELLPEMKTGLMFQEARLLPWLNVEQNIALAARHDATLPMERVPELLALLGLTEAGKLYPHQLSGGMAQRVALGRTLFYNPDVLLMDEPFSALDYFTRAGLQQTIVKLQEREHKTIVFVTHDVEEAVLLGDRVIVMDNGEIKDDVYIDLPRPRLATLPEVQALRQKILSLL